MLKINTDPAGQSHADSANRVLRIGVIGCGAIAELYHLPALKKISCLENGIVLVDPNQTRLKEMASKFHAASASASYRDIADAVDGVIVATPPSTHFDISKWFLEHRVHVLCEKPLTEDSAQARELVEIANRNQVHLAVNQTRRFFPTYQLIRQLIADAALGKLRSIRYHDGIEFDWPAASQHHFAKGARGAWSDTGVHLLDSVLYWLGQRPTLVSSLNDSLGGPEAIACVNLEHQGCEIEIKVSRLGRLDNGFRIEGRDAYIEASAEDWSEITVCHRNGSKQRVRPSKQNYRAYTDFAVPLLQNFADAINGKASPFVSGESTVATIELLEEAYNRVETFDMPWNAHWGGSK